MPHSNQDTKTNIESYHVALKRWFILDTKGFRGCMIDYNVAINNNHCTPLRAHVGNEEKKFHKKQGYGGHCYMKCGKGSPYSIHPCVVKK
jgi:hypothetical protein